MPDAVLIVISGYKVSRLYFTAKRLPFEGVEKVP
jgi:hypothetical protein